MIYCFISGSTLNLFQLVILVFTTQQTHSESRTNHRVSVKISRSRSLGHSLSQCGWSATPPWSSLTTAARHRSPGASRETAAYCLFLAHSPLVYSNLGEEEDEVSVRDGREDSLKLQSLSSWMELPTRYRLLSEMISDFHKHTCCFCCFASNFVHLGYHQNKTPFPIFHCQWSFWHHNSISFCQNVPGKWNCCIVVGRAVQYLH